MKVSNRLRHVAVVTLFSLVLAGCGGGGSTPDQGASGTPVPPPTQADIQKIEAGRGAMGPAGVPKK